MIEYITENVESDLNYETSKLYFVNGFISYIKSDDNTVYMACPESRNKVQKQGDDYYCEKCQKVVTDPNPTYMLTGKITDSTGSIFVKLYGDQAKQVMAPTTEQQYLVAKQASANDEKELKDLLSSKYYKNFTFMISAKQSQFSTGRIDYSAIRVYPGNFREANGTMLKHLNGYKTQETTMTD